MDSVRPWKLPSQVMICARSSGTPLTWYPHLRAVFSAVSTASAPEFIGSAASLPHSSASSATNGPNWSWWNAREVSVTRASCSRAAASSTGLRCPKFSAEYPASMSR